jgi:hypothetical protein
MQLSVGLAISDPGMAGKYLAFAIGHSLRNAEKCPGKNTREDSAMSDADSAAISAVRKDWVSEHREIYLQSGGAKGHVMNITAAGAYSDGVHCLLKYTGRKSGRVWAVLVDNFPFYATYQASTSRVLPLVMMKLSAEIPVFKESEATGWRQF